MISASETEKRLAEPEIGGLKEKRIKVALNLSTTQKDFWVVDESDEVISKV